MQKKGSYQSIEGHQARIISHFQDTFCQLMKSLPVTVEDEDIDEMFTAANIAKDGRISYEEFKVREEE